MAQALREKDAPLLEALLAISLSIVQIPVAILFALGFFGFLVLVVASHSIIEALRFDFFFAVGCILWLLPTPIAYLIGSVARLVLRVAQSDSFMGILVFFASIACFLFGFGKFSSAIGWDAIGGWAQVAAFVSFFLTYISGLAAGVTAAGRAPH
jgi:hypothetical protein